MARQPGDGFHFILFFSPLLFSLIAFHGLIPDQVSFTAVARKSHPWSSITSQARAARLENKPIVCAGRPLLLVLDRDVYLDQTRCGNCKVSNRQSSCACDPTRSNRGGMRENRKLTLARDLLETSTDAIRDLFGSRSRLTLAKVLQAGVDALRASERANRGQSHTRTRVHQHDGIIGRKERHCVRIPRSSLNFQAPF